MIPKVITDNAACRGRVASREFYRSADSVKHVREFTPLPADHICFSCSVRVECHRYALYNEALGTWGGKKEWELDAERKALGIPTPSYNLLREG